MMKGFKQFMMRGNVVDLAVAVVMGAAFGVVAYATSDLTNQATLAVWADRVTLLDLAWGATVTGVSSLAATAALRPLVRRNP